jgi:UTP--glucose-1-phosphate uridylyltransferase
MRVRKAVITAGGMGTRFLPATKSMPKEMLPIVDKPVVQFVVEEALEAGVEDILFITGRGKQAIENHFDYHPELERFLHEAGKEKLTRQVRDIGERARIHYIRQKEQLGLGDAVRLARDHVEDEPFVLLLGDTIIDSPPGAHPGLVQLLNAFAETGSSVVAVRQVPREQTSRYGIVDGVEVRERLLRLKRLVEKPSPEVAPTNLAIAGRYVFTAGIFDCIDRIGAGVGGEIQLTDAMNLLAQEESVFALDWQARRFDIGDRLEYAKCFIEFALRREEMSAQLRSHLAALIGG